MQPVQTLLCLIPLALLLISVTCRALIILTNPIVRPKKAHASPDIFMMNITNIEHPKWIDVREKILETHTEVCSSSRLCNYTMFGSRFPYVKECSPCRTCYCDVKCERYGDCCLDRIIDVHLLDTYVNETKAYTDLTYAECMDLRVKGIYLKNFDVMQKQTLINKCPAEFNDSIIRSECEDVGPINANLLHLSTTPEDLSKNWPVSSTKSSLYYKNYACAKCHSDGAKNTTVFWSLDLSCQTFPNLPASSDPRSLLSVLLKDKECKVAFRTPENMEPRKCNVLPMVKSEVIDQCNATGKRSLYDAVLWKACDVFSIPMRQFTKYFANTFCARCQTDSKNSLSSTCSSDGMFPFFIVLSPDALDTVQQAHQSYDCRCRKGYIYNPFKVSVHL